MPILRFTTPMIRLTKVVHLMRYQRQSGSSEGAVDRYCSPMLLLFLLWLIPLNA